MSYTYPRSLDPNYIYSGGTLPIRSFNKIYDDPSGSLANVSTLATSTPFQLETKHDLKKVGGFMTAGHLSRAQKTLTNSEGVRKTASASVIVKIPEDDVFTDLEAQELIGVALMSVATISTLTLFLAGGR